MQLPGGRVKNKEVPEDAVAYDESKIRELYEKHVTEHFGADPLRVWWCGRKDALSYQDIVVASKPCRSGAQQPLAADRLTACFSSIFLAVRHNVIRRGSTKSPSSFEAYDPAESAMGARQRMEKSCQELVRTPKW